MAKRPSKKVQPAPKLQAINRLSSYRTKVSALFRDVCGSLRKHVMSLGPGAELSELRLSEELGISRTPIREALIQLSNEGLVQFKPNGRCHVATLSKRDVIEMSDIRAALEAAAARSLAESITAAQLEELRSLASVADRAEKNATSRREWDRKEEEFHRRVLELAGNSRIVELLDRQGLMERLLTLPLDNWQSLAKGDRGPYHEDLVEALASKDPARCDDVFRKHIEVRKQFLLAAFDQNAVEQ